MKKQVMGCVLMVCSALAHADAPSDWRFVGRLGMGMGSTPLDSGFYTDGSSWELSSGNGLKYAVGADYRLGQNLTLQATVGKELSTVPASNGDLTFNRTPVELMGFVDVSKELRVGLGVRSSTGARVSSSGAGTGYTSVGDWTPSTGAVLEAQYLFSSTGQVRNPSQFGVNLRFVSESFTKGAVTKTADHYELGVVLYY